MEAVVQTAGGRIWRSAAMPMKEDEFVPDFAEAAAVPEPVLTPSLSESMRELEWAIRGIAGANLPVLLMGERGTGKEMIAREIHRYQGRPHAPFLSVRCSEQNSIFLESVIGDIWRTVEETPQRGATLFLDEVGELDLACQTVLVEALASRNGAGHPGATGVRMISSTCQNLEEKIRKERFREDLFYRLNGICLRVPPLRRRREDIPAFLAFFLKKHAEKLGRTPAQVGPETREALLQHSWPGNVRELEEVAKRLLVADEETVVAGLTPASPARVTRKATVISLKQAARMASRQVERELILKMLARTHWNRKRAARELGISYKALLYKLKQIAFDDSGER